MTKRKSSLDHQSSANPWIAEEQSKLIADEVNKKSEREDLLLEYQQKVAYYKHQVNQRFHLKHDIPFFETPHGWQIHSREGVKKID
jgi:ABC-type Fe3+-citrate transport system substrate-binding protein